MINPAFPDYDNTPAGPQRPFYHYQLNAPANNKPVVSIITPFYNPGPVFEETVRCVLQQSFQNFEWVIVDDGSTNPDSLRCLAQLAAAEPRVKVIHQPNQGPAVARNRAVKEAATEFIYPLDTDDLIEPTFVEKCLWALTSHPEYTFYNAYSVGFNHQTYLWPRGSEIGPVLFVENLITYASVIRKAAHLATGGYDESIRYGHEDWDYWLNFFSHGFVGNTIPEYLFWYRRLPQSRISETQAHPEKEQAFHDRLEQKYHKLRQDGFPKKPASDSLVAFSAIPVEQPITNPLMKPDSKQRLLMILPWMIMGGADKVNLDLVEHLSVLNYEISICTTLPCDNPWYAEFARFTPDIFHLPNFLKLVDYPRFLVYLINSRQIDTVLISNSYLGYQLLPFLRAYCPQVTFVDYLHSKVDQWNNGGYPRSGTGYQELLDLNLVSNAHLKAWMTEREADPDRIEVCYTNIDTQLWDPAQFDRAALRQALEIPENTPILLYGGRIAEEKRPLVFAEVIRRLAHQEKLNFVCLVTGDGPYLPALKRFVSRHKLKPFIRFLGKVSFKRIQELQATGDIFFLPSEYEGISLTLFESLAMETIPVAADVGGQNELVTPECGFLIPHSQNEIDDYVNVLKQLIESPEKRMVMAQAGRKRIIKNFRLEQMVEQMIDLLNQANQLNQTYPRPTVGKGLGRECATLAIEYTRLEEALGYLWRNPQHLPGIDFAGILQGDREAIKIMLLKIAGRPGLGWLYQYKPVAKRFLK
jgi:glycosyltransferase involved in cell wall biosynthesis